MIAGSKPNFSAYPQEAIVAALQPPDQVIVLLVAHGAGTRVPCRILSHGPDDAYRTEQAPLPAVGTHGLVVAVHGDSRNLMWLGSYHPALNHARTTIEGSGDVTYSAKQSGHWHLIDNNGQETTSYPDGTTITVTPTGTPLTPNRTIVGPVTVNGITTQNVPSTQPVAQAPSGPQLTYQIKLSSGLVFTLQGTTMTVQGNLMVDGSITATGNVTGGYGGSDEILLQNHTHAYVPGTSGNAQTSAPTAGT